MHKRKSSSSGNHRHYRQVHAGIGADQSLCCPHSRSRKQYSIGGPPKEVEVLLPLSLYISPSPPPLFFLFLFVLFSCSIFYSFFTTIFFPFLNRSPAQVRCMRQVLRPVALGRPRGIGWRGRWEGGSGWGTHVNPQLIHVNVRQTHYNIKKK